MRTRYVCPLLYSLDRFFNGYQLQGPFLQSTKNTTSLSVRVKSPGGFLKKKAYIPERMHAF
ncbi:hypothetical protein X546_08440 [Brevibacillus borstelensis cifa_chp40]|nr:hypothetical protein X546_08440 [Brevibacillus borstelensis cifa_chp40]